MEKELNQIGQKMDRIELLLRERAHAQSEEVGELIKAIDRLTDAVTQHGLPQRHEEHGPESQRGA